MPSETTHLTINLILASLLSLILYTNHISQYIIRNLAIGLVVLPVYFSPDVDNLKSKVLKRWNFAGLIWKLTVSKEGPHHRGILHKHFIGPLILCLIPAFFVGVYILEKGDLNSTFIIVGLYLAVECHICLDHLKKYIPFLRD